MGAPLLLVLLRIVPGFAVGGEWGGGVLLVSEHAPNRRRGYYSAWQFANPAAIRVTNDEDEKAFTTYSNYLANTAEQVDDEELVLAAVTALSWPCAPGSVSPPPTSTRWADLFPTGSAGRTLPCHP